uniref:Uncharacterized protein n=1 Tax=Nonomuraea gerenzanensis TaxID=93944 RepID=A0A1M4E483_9ACTN|nr:hypothetical protein BN4615_P3189 [Nonomuraea gerenzanensis]
MRAGARDHHPGALGGQQQGWIVPLGRSYEPGPLERRRIVLGHPALRRRGGFQIGVVQVTQVRVAASRPDTAHSARTRDTIRVEIATFGGRS